MIYKRLIFLTLLLFIREGQAQNTNAKNMVLTDAARVERSAEEGIKFFFEIDKFVFDKSFSTNAEQLRRLDEIMADENALVGLDSLQLVAAASLDGNEHKNAILAANRVETIKKLLLSRYTKVTPQLVHTKSIAEEWVEFRAMIEKDDNMPYKAEVLKAIDSNREPDTKEWIIKTMKNREVWDYLKIHTLPQGRYGASLVFYYNINRKKIIEELKRPTEIRYLQDTIKEQDTLMVTDTIRVNMSVRKFKKNYDVEVFPNR